jgi:copper chaperone CopZ
MRIPSYLLAPLVLVVFFGTILIGRTWELPTMGQKFADSSGEPKTVQVIVEGLRCRGTSNFFMKKVEKTPGLLSVSTFVQEHRAEIRFDPSQIDTRKIRQVIEEPVRLQDGRLVKPFKVVEIRD